MKNNCQRIKTAAGCTASNDQTGTDAQHTPCNQNTDQSILFQTVY